MPRKRSSSFILELPLRTSLADERACAIMPDAARNIANAVPGEGLRRLDLMHESKASQAARKMSRGEPRSPARTARATEFKRLFEAFGFTGHGFQKFAQACRDNCWIKDHLPGHVAQTAATRAFNALLQYAFAKRGRPRFKRSHSELANRILGQGTTVKTEKLSYTAWQRQRYGKSLKVRAPGMFVRILERKAASGGELIAFATRNTCLSQFGHVEGTYEKKPLKPRYHQFADATRVGRDLYCAFLARYVRDGCLDAIKWLMLGQVRKAFLRAAADGFEPARGRGFALPHVTLGVRAGRSNNGAHCTREAGNAVALAHLAAARVPQSSAGRHRSPSL
jgi:hypothetical protein